MLSGHRGPEVRRRPGLEVVPGLAAAAATEEGREGEVEAGVDEVADRGEAVVDELVDGVDSVEGHVAHPVHRVHGRVPHVVNLGWEYCYTELFLITSKLYFLPDV